MKRKSTFSVLPEKEQAEIIGLCEAYTFNQVVEFLAKPRPEGFDLKTSYSALRRFYTNHNPQAYNTAVLSQLAQSLCHHYEASNGAFSTAIMSMLESRLLTALKNEIPIADLQVEFRTLFNAQKAFLALQKWCAQGRAGACPAAAAISAEPASSVGESARLSRDCGGLSCNCGGLACSSVRPRTEASDPSPAPVDTLSASEGASPAAVVTSPEQSFASGLSTQDSGLDSSDTGPRTQDSRLFPTDGFIRQYPSENPRKAALAAKSHYEKIHE